MTEHELPKLHPNTEYIRKAIGARFAESDIVTKRVEVSREGERLLDGRVLDIGALSCEDGSIPITYHGLDGEVIGRADALERDPETGSVTMEITVPAIYDLELFGYSAFADSVVTDHQEEVQHIVWARLRAIYLLPNAGFPRRERNA